MALKAHVLDTQQGRAVEERISDQFSADLQGFCSLSSLLRFSCKSRREGWWGCPMLSH